MTPRNALRRIAAGAVAIAAVAASASAAAEEARAGSTSRSLDRALDRIVEARGSPPGLSVLIKRDDRQEFRHRGFADVDRRRRPTAGDHMRLASVSKAYSGAVVLRLVERGQLSLDDTIGELLPGLLPAADEVTLRRALGHTGGLPDFTKDPEFAEDLMEDPRGYLSPRRLVRYVRDDPLNFPPGARYEYSDTDNIVVGLMAEAATGRSYERLLRRIVYRPLGLKETSLPRTVRMPKPYLHGYEVVPEEPPEDVSELLNPSLAWASGGMVSTPRELGRFIRAYVGGGLFDLPRRRPERPFIAGGESQPPGPGRNGAGLGLFRYRTGCGTVYGHTGSFPGYRMFAASTPSGRRSVVFSVSSQIIPAQAGAPGQGSPRVASLIRRAQKRAVCHALR